LNEDGVVSIADATYLDQCIHTQQDQGILPGLMEPCAWDPEIVDISETATLGITNLNTTDGYFDVTITNADGMVNAMQFDISGANIMSVESLLPNTTWSSHIFFEDEGTKIAALGHLGTMIPVNFTPLPVLRVHYANINNNEICIGNIDEVINVFMHNILTQVGPCVPVSEMINNPVLPSPIVSAVLLYLQTTASAIPHVLGTSLEERLLFQMTMKLLCNTAPWAPTVLVWSLPMATTATLYGTKMPFKFQKPSPTI
jgi:hypothetical protein